MIQQAILVVSFGSSYEETIQKSIGQIEGAIQKAYPQYVVYRAFTSERIKHKLHKEGKEIDDVKEALERMHAVGIKKVIVQPTFIISGVEYNRMCEVAKAYKGLFDEIKIGRPLLSSVEDYFKVIKAFTSGLGVVAADEAIICMGHGAEHFMSVSYAALDYMFKDSGHSNIYVATIGSYPRIETVIKQLKEKGYQKVRLVPFMVVAGYHVKKTMIEEVEESWEKQLQKAGFEVSTQIEGLGENEGIRKIYIEHVADCLSHR